MLQKVFAINIFDLKFSKKSDNIWDFLIYLFPHYLKKATRQGVYKKYKRQLYNNAKVKGTIDVSGHIRSNIPFNGKVAYNVREYDFDNSVTQLIRHTIEYISVHTIGGKNILTTDVETRQAVSQILSVTPSYNQSDRYSVINANRRHERHPYYTEYTFLQQLCLRILRREKLSYGESNDNIYGLLFDGAWLWEEYLNTILKKANFTHPQNRERSGTVYLFQSHRCPRYPDFYKNNIVIDAKYKRLRGLNVENIDRNDMNQIITYLYVLGAAKGGFIYPIEKTESNFLLTNKLGVLEGYEGEVYLYGVPITTCETFNEFSKAMNAIENDIIEKFNLQ